MTITQGTFALTCDAIIALFTETKEHFSTYFYLYQSTSLYKIHFTILDIRWLRILGEVVFANNRGLYEAIGRNKTLSVRWITFLWAYEDKQVSEPAFIKIENCRTIWKITIWHRSVSMQGPLPGRICFSNKTNSKRCFAAVLPWIHFLCVHWGLN